MLETGWRRGVNFEPSVPPQNARRWSPRWKWRSRERAKEAKLCYSANAMMENRNGLLIEFALEPADGYAERKSARAMLVTTLPGSRRIILGADKGYGHG